jgi:hypothetical protein
MTATSRELVSFAVALAEEFPRVAGMPALVLKLVRLSKRHHRLQELGCNRGLSAAEEAAEKRCEDAIQRLCRGLGCEPVFSGDPRGCTVKLRLPSGRTNDFAGTGLCVPQ